MSSQLEASATSVSSNSQHQVATPPKAAKPLRIPFRYLNGFLIVDVVINNRLPLSFIFDTGSKHTILTDEAYIPFLGQLPEEEIQLIGSDLSVPITGHIMRRTALSAGEVDLKNQSLILLEGGILDLNVLTGETIHGILGIGAFGAYGVKINYQTGVIDLLEPENIRPNKKSIVLPIRVESSKAYVSIVADLHPGFQQNLSLLLDTGASLSMLIHAAKSDSTMFPAKVVTGTFGYGLGGYLVGYVGRSDLITLGGYALADIVTHFQVVEDSDNLRDLPSREGILGNGVLDRFTVLIDFSRKELHLLPNRKSKRRVEYDRSGMRLVRNGEKLDKIRVQHVVKDSPADLAGILIGDELISVGGIPIAIRSISRIESLFRGKVGKTFKLVTRRNGQLTKREILLADLI